MEKRFKFTTNKIASLPPNDPNSRSTEAEYSCSELSGFKVLVGKNGRKKWLVRYTLNGRKGSLSLGTFPEVSLADARKQAQRTKLMVAEGVDPKNSTVKPDIPTVSEYFNNHFIKISKSRKKSWRHDIARFNHCVEIWDISYDQLRVSHIQSMVAGLIDKVHLRGKKLSRSTINRVLCLLKLMGRMIEEEYSIPNVAARVKLFPETGARERWLSPQEIKRIFEELRKPDYCPIRSRFIILLFMLGCRERSLRAARWPNIDLENGVMRIPREDSKNGFQHQIQLTPQAIQEFRFLLRLKKKGNPYVFPGQKEKSHISQPRHLFNKIKKELMLKEPEQIVFHTARHSYASSLISAGVDVGVLKQLLGHKSISSTMRYARAGNESLRQSSQVLIQLIDEA